MRGFGEKKCEDRVMIDRGLRAGFWYYIKGRSQFSFLVSFRFPTRCPSVLRARILSRASRVVLH